jgi:hypothetical protein
MKKVLAILVCIGFVFSAPESIFGQERPVNNSPADTTGVKIKVPQKQIRKQNGPIKKDENQNSRLPKPQFWNSDRSLLIKEKDSLQRKTD